MKTVFQYCPSLPDRIARLRRLFVERAPDAVGAVMNPPLACLKKFASRYPAGRCACPDPEERIRFWEAMFAEREAVEDDSIPSAYLTEMDQGLYGGLVGGKTHFLADPATGWISSMLFPLLEDWAGFDVLKVDFENEWGQRYREQLAAFVKGAAGKFGLSHFILIDGLNFMYELFGATRTYTELIDNPEKVRRVIDFAYDLNAKVQDYFFEKVPLILGGTCSNMVQWLPGKIVTESVDPFHMTSVDYFEEWGRAPVERIFTRYDGGVVHIHGNGRHLLKAVSSLKGLKGIFLGDDKGYPLAFDVLPEIRRRVGDMPLVLEVAQDKFARALESRRLAGGVLYMVNGMPDIAAANRLMEKVREYQI